MLGDWRRWFIIIIIIIRAEDNHFLVHGPHRHRHHFRRRECRERRRMTERPLMITWKLKLIEESPDGQMQYRGKDTKVTKQSKQNNMVRSVQPLSFNFLSFLSLGPSCSFQINWPWTKPTWVLIFIWQSPVPPQLTQTFTVSLLFTYSATYSVTFTCNVRKTKCKLSVPRFLKFAYELETVIFDIKTIPEFRKKIMSRGQKGRNDVAPCGGFGKRTKW